MVDTEAYLGDILSFGELTMAFQFVPILQPERQKSALDNAVHYANMHADGRRVPKDYELVARTVRELSKKGTRQFAEARALMSSSLSRDPFCAEGWAQVSRAAFASATISPRCLSCSPVSKASAVLPLHLAQCQSYCLLC